MTQIALAAAPTPVAPPAPPARARAAADPFAVRPVPGLGALQVPAHLRGTHAGLFHLLRMQALMAAPAAVPDRTLEEIPDRALDGTPERTPAAPRTADPVTARGASACAALAPASAGPRRVAPADAIPAPRAIPQPAQSRREDAPITIAAMGPTSIAAATIPPTPVRQALRPAPAPTPAAPHPPEARRRRSWQEVLMSDTFLFRPAAQG